MRELNTAMRDVPNVVMALALMASAAAYAVGGPNPQAPSPPAPPKLFIEIAQGEEVVNNVKQRVARDPQIVVYDENHNPVNGATVVFFLPKGGPGASFPGGQTSFTTTTGANGQATAPGLQANNVVGSYKINVVVTSQGQTATTTIPMANVLAATVAGTTVLTTVVFVAVGAGVAGATAGVLLSASSGPVSPSK